MNTNFNNALSPAFPAGFSQEGDSNTLGDFKKIGSLGNVMRNTIDQFRNASNLPGNPLQTGATANRYNPLSAETALQVSNNVRQNGEATAQAVFDTLLGDRSLVSMPPWNENLFASEKPLRSQLPTTNVLFEACTLNQPLNASLRDRCSTGTYYFLK